MDKYNTMNELSEKNNGYLLTSEVQAEDISRTYLHKFVKDNNYERVAAGVYISPETWPDPFYILQLVNRETVFSNDTALYLHDLMDREPKQMTVAVKRGYNATHLKNKGVKPYYLRKDLFEEGVTEVETGYGNKVKVYDIDRTICDLINRKEETDIQVFQTAIKEYMRGSEKNLFSLMKYAKQLGIESKVREYTELLL